MTIEKMNEATALYLQLREYKKTQDFIQNNKSIFDLVRSANDFLGEDKTHEILASVKLTLMNLIEQKGIDILNQIDKL